MKLYIREDFLKLPAGTIYSRHPGDRNDQRYCELMGGLYCKASGPEDYSNDWIVQDLIGEPGFPAGIDDGNDAFMYQINLRDTFQDFRTDLDCGGRDGLYDDTDKFIVWDEEDISKLQHYLTTRFDKK